MKLHSRRVQSDREGGPACNNDGLSMTGPCPLMTKGGHRGLIQVAKETYQLLRQSKSNVRGMRLFSDRSCKSWWRAETEAKIACSAWLIDMDIKKLSFGDCPTSDTRSPVIDYQDSV